jgi:dolichol kinase
MKLQLLFSFVYLIGFIGLLAICELLHKKSKLSVEYTRKIGHIASTLSTLFFPVIFHSYGYVMAIGIFSFALLYIGKHFMLFKSIDSVERKTEGSYLLPVSICSIFILSQEKNLFYILPILVLGISDSLAGILGTLYRDRTSKIVLFKHDFNKTILGTIAFSISTFIILLIGLNSFHFDSVKLILLSLFITFITTIIEVISPKGTDNLTVPHSILILLYLLLTTG